jgi:hypothetical protein
MILKGIAAGKLTFAFNQNGGSTDIQLPIELNVASTDAKGVRVRNDNATSNFIDCAAKLTPQ